MDQTVPLWAFVTLALAAPVLALLGVIVSTRSETRRSHQNWLRQTKYESYERLFVVYAELKDAYSAFLDSDPVVTPDVLERLRQAERKFREQNERTQLVASMRTALAAEQDMGPTWFAIYWQLQDAKAGMAPPKPPASWGDHVNVREAVRVDLGARRDDKWFGGRYDRRRVVPHWTVSGAMQSRWRSFKRTVNPVARREEREWQESLRLQTEQNETKSPGPD